MIRLMGIAVIAAVLTGGAAQASIITFSGSIAQEGDAAVSFNGRVNDTAKTGSVTIDYFFDDPPPRGPIFGTDTITGTGSYSSTPQGFPPDGNELDIKVANATSAFELEGSERGLTVSGFDPAKGFNFIDRVDPSSLSIAVSNVPLPSAAPLFGAGLVALGAAGYCARRQALGAAVKPQRVSRRFAPALRMPDAKITPQGPLPEG